MQTAKKCLCSRTRNLNFGAFEKGLGGRDLNRKRVRVTGVGGGVGANQTTYWYQNRKIMRRGSWEPGIIHLEKVFFFLSKKRRISNLANAGQCALLDSLPLCEDYVSLWGNEFLA